MLSALLTVVLPVLLILGLGALVGNRLSLDSTTINRLNLYLLTPTLALNTLLHTEARPRELATLVLGYFVLSGSGVLLGYGGGAPWNTSPGQRARDRNARRRDRVIRRHAARIR